MARSLFSATVCVLQASTATRTATSPSSQRSMRMTSCFSTAPRTKRRRRSCEPSVPSTGGSSETRLRLSSTTSRSSSTSPEATTSIRKVGSLLTSGDDIQGIYLLAAGELELELRRPKNIVGVNLTDPQSRRDHQFRYRRSIVAPYLFGVEELVTCLPKKKRIFDVTVKSLKSCFYLLPLEVDCC